MRPEDLEITTATHFAEYGEYALSVFAEDGLDTEEIAQVAELPHGVIRESTVERIREAGYEVVPSTWIARGHADLKLPNPPSDEDWRRLEEVFSEPKPNVGQARRS